MCILHALATDTENRPVGFPVHFRRLAETRLRSCTGRPFRVLEKLFKRGRSCTFLPIRVNTASLPRPLLCNRISLDVRGVRLGTGLKSRSPSIFYTVAPKDRLKSPLGQIPRHFTRYNVSSHTYHDLLHILRLSKVCIPGHLQQKSAQ